eukprot:tig00020516_g9966.t1
MPKTKPVRLFQYPPEPGVEGYSSFAQISTMFAACAPVCAKKSFLAGSTSEKRTICAAAPQSGVRMARTKSQKNASLAALKEELNGAQAVFALEYKGLLHKQFEDLRKKMPEGTKIQVAKNTIMNLAIKEQPQMVQLGDFLAGPNAFFIVKEDVPSTLKAFSAYVKENKIEGVTFRGGVFDGSLINSGDIKKLENMPSRTELMAQLARALNAVPTKLAVGVNAVPTKLARAVNLALVEGKSE